MTANTEESTSNPLDVEGDRNTDLDRDDLPEGNVPFDALLLTDIGSESDGAMGPSADRMPDMGGANAGDDAGGSDDIHVDMGSSSHNLSDTISNRQ